MMGDERPAYGRTVSGCGQSHKEIKVKHTYEELNTRTAGLSNLTKTAIWDNFVPFVMCRYLDMFIIY